MQNEKCSFSYCRNQYRETHITNDGEKIMGCELHREWAGRQSLVKNAMVMRV